MTPQLGATPLGDGRTEFFVWAPNARLVEAALDDGRRLRLGDRGNGYHSLIANDVAPGARYRYSVDGREVADPSSRFQPRGVHGPSQVVDPAAFSWDDEEWPGRPLSEYVLYELHVGTLTPEGTFDAVIPHLDEFRELGITAVELMPVAQFPGTRNWGYDGVFPYAVQNSYGGPEGLRRLVNECHRRGLVVVLDVVYNHVGPEGCVLAEFGPYFTTRYRTPWGEAINFDGPASDEVRRYFVENALRWSSEFHVDALRLDAIHGIVDASARPFLQELSEAAEAHDRPLLLIAETDQNDWRVATRREHGGLGLHAQWSDDFHHALHAYLTGERQGYYEDFGSLGQIAKAYREGFVYSGQHSAFRDRRYGSSSALIPGERLVIFTQNHDQVGNRFAADRLSTVLTLDQLKLVTGLLLLAPYVPLLFMGEEYGELAPFHYFISHTDPELVEKVRRGRREEFLQFGWGDEVSDPQDESTFQASKLDHALREKEPHRTLLDLYRALLRLRTSDPALRSPDKDSMDVQTDEGNGLMTVRRWAGGHEVLAAFNLSDRDAELQLGPAWRVTLRSVDEDRGPGRVPSMSFVVMVKEGSG